MTTRIIDCFEALQWDGGERQVHECYVNNYKDAKAIAGEHGAVVAKTFIIHDSAHDYNHWKSGKIREAALAKLSREEQIALGLTPKPEERKTLAELEAENPDGFRNPE